MDLTNKQKAFIREYLIDGNGTQAAIRAGYSAATAESQASRLLRNVKIREAVESAQQKTLNAALEKRQITKERLLEMAETVYDAAIEAGQLSAANGAIKELGILSGERVEKQENTIVSHEDRIQAIRERMNGERRPTAH